MADRSRTLLIVGLVFACLVAGVLVVRSRVADDVGDASGDAEEAATTRVVPTSDTRPNRADPPPIDPRIAHVPRDIIAANLDAPLILVGEVVEASGGSPERPGARCRLGVDRTQDDGRCRVVLECGTSWLHGDAILHHTPCVVSGRRLVSLADETMSRRDQDPSLLYDSETQRITLGDDRAGPYGEYTLVVHVDDPNLEWERNDAL